MHYRLAFLASLLLLPLTGCDSADNPIAPNGSVLNVTASPSRIRVDETSIINVDGFRPDGSRLATGTQIRVTSDIGQISDPVIEIDDTGRARTTLRADGRIGTAVVTAQLTSGTGEGTASVDIADFQPVISITASPSVIDAGESSDITFTARDENGFPVGEGNIILLTADLGRILDNGSEVDRVTTNADGRASVRFVAGERAGDGQVCGFLNNSEEVCTMITIQSEPANLVLTSDRSTIGSNGGTINLEAFVTDAEGDRSSQELVEFRISTPGVSGDFNPGAGFTDNQGQVSSILMICDTCIPDSVNSFVITASVPGGPSDSVTIQVQ